MREIEGICEEKLERGLGGSGDGGLGTGDSRPRAPEAPKT